MSEEDSMIDAPGDNPIIFLFTPLAAQFNLYPTSAAMTPKANLWECGQTPKIHTEFIGDSPQGSPQGAALLRLSFVIIAALRVTDVTSIANSFAAALRSFQMHFHDS
jgi:hypothetical protein